MAKKVESGTPPLHLTLDFQFDANWEETLDVRNMLNHAVLQIAAETGLTLLKRRITQHHKRADGTMLSPYSTEPISVRVRGIGTGNPLLKPRGGVKNKTGKYMFFAGGYREVRAKVGRTTKKDFTLTGNLMGTRFKVLHVKGGKATIGWPGGAKQGRVAYGLDKLENGLAFAWSEKEQEAILRTAQHFIIQGFADQGWVEDPPALQLADLEG